VECVAANLSNLDETRALIHRLAAHGPALKGIVHAAVAYDDALLSDMTRERLAGVLAPKVAGAINLTRAVLERGIALDHFVSFSSLAAVIGWAGQSNYAAANAALPALAHYQRRLGLPGQCIAWGALAESGFVARNPAVSSHLTGSGWIGLDDAEALDALKTALASDAAVVTYAGAHWRTLALAHPAFAHSPRLAGLIEAQDGAAAHSGDPTAAHAGATPQARAEAFVRAHMGKVLHVEAEALAPFETLDDAGLDSLSSLELRSRLEAAIGQPVPMARFTQAGSIAELAALVRVLIDAGSGPAQQESAGSDEPPAPQAPEAPPAASQTTRDDTIAAAE
jgi:acyl carrier protein